MKVTDNLLSVTFIYLLVNSPSGEGRMIQILIQQISSLHDSIQGKVNGCVKVVFGAP